MDAYLFDLGNVLAGFDHRIFCRRLAEEGSPLDPEAIHGIVFREGFNDRFETGDIRGEDFYTQLKSRLELTVGMDRFRRIWCEIFWENPGMGTLLEALANRARLILVSNTNPWHLAYTREHTRLLEPFHRLVLSYEVGVQKPDPAFFRAALDAAGSAPHRCLYFDDILENVETAARLGIPSVHFRFASPPWGSPETLGATC